MFRDFKLSLHVELVLKIFHDKSATSPFASPCLEETVKSATSATRHGEVGDVANKSTARICRELVADVTGKSA